MNHMKILVTCETITKRSEAGILSVALIAFPNKQTGWKP
jgi:hypothetical protein